MYNSIQDFITFSNKIYDAIADHLAYEVHTGTEVLCISPSLQVCIHHSHHQNLNDTIPSSRYSAKKMASSSPMAKR